MKCPTDLGSDWLLQIQLFYFPATFQCRPSPHVRTSTVMRPCLAILLFALLVTSAIGDDWPNWRGPNFDGNSKELLPEILPEKPSIAWKARLGKGFSTVSVSRGRVISMGNTDEIDTIWCLDAKTGQMIWKHSYECALDPRYYEGGPSSTPTIDGDAVYTLSKKGHAFRLDFETGNVIWQRNLKKDYDMKLPEWSFASSPYRHGNLVILNCGGAGIALNADTGKTVWKSNSEPSGYATAVPFTRHGKTELLLFVAEELISVNPDSGEVLWRFSSKCSRNVNAADPIVDGNRVMISSSPGAVCLELGPGDQPDKKIVWETRDLRTYFNPSVRVGNYVYAIHGTTHRPTELVCIDWKTGKSLWAEPNFGSGALMASVDQLIVFDKGVLTICPASPDGFKPIMQTKILEGKCWTVPVLANGRIYCRNAEGDLACLELTQ